MSLPSTVLLPRRSRKLRGQVMPVGREALLHQPHGFEGLVSLLIKADTGDLAIPNRVHEGALSKHLDAVPAAEASYVRNNDRLANIDETFRADSNLVERLEVARPKSQVCVDPR